MTLFLVGMAIIVSASPTPLGPLKTRLVARAPNDTCGPVYCAGTNNTNDNSYFCGDLRLGPKQLPTEIPLSSEILGYDRLGGLCPGAFLQKWWNSTSAGYIYPPQNGFQLNTANQPIDGNQTLAVGTRLDRFGSEYGAFLAPAGAPFSERAIPPSNLNTPADPSYPYNYHVYEVVQSFDVLSGPIAAWFGQPGQGTQYQTYSNILALVGGGYLRRVNATATSS